MKTVIAEGRTPIILTNLTSHVRILTELLQPHAMHVSALSVQTLQKRKIWQWKNWNKIADSDSLVIIATGKYIGEGFELSQT